MALNILIDIMFCAAPWGESCEPALYLVKRSTIAYCNAVSQLINIHINVKFYISFIPDINEKIYN